MWSFAWCCAMIDLNPTYIRAAVAKMRVRTDYLRRSPVTYTIKSAVIPVPAGPLANANVAA